MLAHHTSYNSGVRLLYNGAMATLLDRISAFCTRYALLPPGATVVVAVSGGPDSLCLLDVLRQLAPRWSLQLHVAHLDHQLRAESADDARFVAELAESWQLPISLGREDVAAYAAAERIGIEAAARELRYRFLIRTAQTHGAEVIALGHTADDQAETVLLRLLRGAGPHGLAAMRPQRPAYRPAQPQPDATPIPLIVRPLLEIARTEIERYCAERQLEPRLDPSNAQTRYTRNRVRGYILPLLKTYNTNIVATLGRTARVCAEEDDLLEQLVGQCWPTIVSVEARRVRLERRPLVAQHRALQRRIIQRAAALVVPAIELSARHLDLALAAINAAPHATPQRVQLPQGLWLHLRPDQLYLSVSAALARPVDD